MRGGGHAVVFGRQRTRRRRKKNASDRLKVPGVRRVTPGRRFIFEFRRLFRGTNIEKSFRSLTLVGHGSKVDGDIGRTRENNSRTCT